MRLIGVCIARNEGDIIEAFVRHNLSVLDGLLVVDHGSVDGTRRILLDLVDEGLNLDVGQLKDPAFNQSRIMSELTGNAFRSRDVAAVVPLDADEFLSGIDREGLLAAVIAAGAGASFALRWSNRACGADGPSGLRAMTFMPRVEAGGQHKILITRPPDGMVWGVASGNHAARLTNAVGQFNEPAPRSLGGQLVHFPLRSPEQAVAKALFGWAAWAKGMGGGSHGHLAWHWREWAAAFVRSREFPNLAQLQHHAGIAYAGSTPKAITQWVPAPPFSFPDTPLTHPGDCLTAEQVLAAVRPMLPTD